MLTETRRSTREAYGVTLIWCGEGQSIQTRSATSI